MRRQRAAGLLPAALLLFGLPAAARGQQQAPPAGQPPDASQGRLEAGDDEVGDPVRKLITWNEFRDRKFHIRFGGGFLYEYAAYAQDAASKEQFAMHPLWMLRDTRLLIKGGFDWKRPVTFTAGIMYDEPADKLEVRQSGIMVAVPELWGHVFIGRQKEGVSLNKVMNGYSGWTMERATISDATLPILADGIKWMGHLPRRHLSWSLGYYRDTTSEHQKFSTYEHQVAARMAWAPPVEQGDTVLHLGLSARYGKPEDGRLRVRSRPEAFEAPYFVDTGAFPARSARLAGLEAYYRPGPLLVGTEYYVQEVDALEKGHPLFHGGDVVVSWMASGETRRYNAPGAFFEGISPARPVFEGGPGGWELVVRFSYIDLDDGALRGGKFWRLTPMVNWHLSDNVRLELTYGYGSLERFDLVGKTQFFQTRLQLQL
jgi:phosphate-selective porin OprO/OprP